MQCSYCNLWNHDHSKELEPDVWVKTLPPLLDILSTPKVNFSGGEPMLSPVLFDLLTICVERGAFPVFVTNGRLLNEKNVDRLAELNIANINISLDDDRPQVFDRIRNMPGHTELLLNNIHSLRKALRTHNCHTVVYLKSVIHAGNIDRLAHMVNLAKDHQCRITFQPLSAQVGAPSTSNTVRAGPGSATSGNKTSATSSWGKHPKTKSSPCANAGEAAALRPA